MAKILGFSAGFHDAAVSMIDEHGNIMFAAHSERYSKKKHDEHLHHKLMQDALDTCGKPDIVAYYERPWAKKIRNLRAGQYADAFNMKDITAKRYMRNHLDGVDTLIGKADYRHYNHHLSHAAAGFQTSPFKQATVVVIDAIGELDTISIYSAEYNYDIDKAHYKKLWSRKYPDSIGLFYSAITKRVGLKPLDEEYILMGMAAYGEPLYAGEMRKKLFDGGLIKTSENMHIGLPDDFLPCPSTVTEEQHNYNIAASAQAVVEELICEVMAVARSLDYSGNLVYCGGVALNCSANRLIGKFFPNIWIMPNPGDAGSSLGAAALAYGKKLNWKGPYLGTDIPGPYPVKDLIDELELSKIAGVASGRAEFGPRALGNRSLLADPRGPEIKDKVNEIKRRQKFRPFAPVILEEYVHEYFGMPAGFPTSPYMQVVAHCKMPESFPAIIHADGTSRVQTVGKDCTSGIRQLLEEWHAKTGCPMLLNTSLNIRGEPMVNDRIDADRFEQLYNVKVFS